MSIDIIVNDRCRNIGVIGIETHMVILFNEFLNTIEDICNDESIVVRHVNNVRDDYRFISIILKENIPRKINLLNIIRNALSKYIEDNCIGKHWFVCIVICVLNSDKRVAIFDMEIYKLMYECRYDYANILLQKRYNIIGSVLSILDFVNIMYG